MVLQNFKQNAAWNFSAYLLIRAPTLYTRILFLELKRSVHAAQLLATSDENFNLHANLTVPLLFPGMFMGDVLRGIYFVFEAHFFMRSTFLHVGKTLLCQRGVDFRPFLTLQPDFVPFTMWIAFPEPTWVSMLRTAEVYTSWLLSGAVGRCSMDS